MLLLLILSQWTDTAPTRVCIALCYSMRRISLPNVRYMYVKKQQLEYHGSDGSVCVCVCVCSVCVCMCVCVLFF